MSAIDQSIGFPQRGCRTRKALQERLQLGKPAPFRVLTGGSQPVLDSHDYSEGLRPSDSVQAGDSKC